MKRIHCSRRSFLESQNFKSQRLSRSIKYTTTIATASYSRSIQITKTSCTQYSHWPQNLNSRLVIWEISNFTCSISSTLGKNIVNSAPKFLTTLNLCDCTLILHQSASSLHLETLFWMINDRKWSMTLNQLFSSSLTDEFRSLTVSATHSNWPVNKSWPTPLVNVQLPSQKFSSHSPSSIWEMSVMRLIRKDTDVNEKRIHWRELEETFFTFSLQNDTIPYERLCVSASTYL